ncbi:methyltransferase domain-containing protein [candidate division WOR-3 bacterium]|nr:methyltransferase domain-containing protein [candidate division WOR-3 bacterium]
MKSTHKVLQIMGAIKSQIKDGEKFIGSFDRQILIAQIGSIGLMSRECGLKIEDQIVLDAGCGFGTRSMIFALLGAKKVYSVDVDKVRLNGLKSHLESWELSYHPLKNIEIAISEVQSFSPALAPTLIYSNEIISHLWNREEFYNHSYEILSKGGTLYISDTNNSLNKRISSHREALWREAEAPKGTIYEGRKRFIKSNFPEFKDSEIDYLTMNTCYQKPDEIIEAVKYYIDEEKLKKESSFIEDRAPFDPEYDFLPCEGLIDFFETKAYLEKLGFKVELFPHFCGAKRPILRPINSFSRLFPLMFSLRYARAVHIVATKCS